MDPPKVDLTTTIVRELALNPDQLMAVVSDEVVRSRLSQRDRDVITHRRESGDRTRRRNVAFALR